MLKLHLPSGERDMVNITSLWGVAKLNAQNTSSEEIGSGSGILVGGIDWQHLYSDEWLGHVLVNYVENRYNEGFGDNGTEETALDYSTAKSTLTFTPNHEHSIELGLSAQRASYNLTNVSGTGFDTSIHSNFYEAYLNWNWHIVPELVLNAGVFSQFVSFDSGSSFEPRASLAWSPYEEHTFSLAFGVHRQPDPFAFAQALHYVAGYTYRASDDLLFKAETYLKQYSDVPIHASTLDSYSFLNEGFAERLDYSDLTNAGNGERTARSLRRSNIIPPATLSPERPRSCGKSLLVRMASGISVHSTISIFSISLPVSILRSVHHPQ